MEAVLLKQLLMLFKCEKEKPTKVHDSRSWTQKHIE